MTSRMRLRALLAVATIAAIAVPAAATGKGTVSVIAFSAGLKDGKPVVIKNLKVGNVPVDCRQGTTTFSSPRGMPRLDVSKRLRFKGVERYSGAKLKVTGKYSHDLETVKGTMKVKGRVGGFTGCNSGKIHWKSV